jgi:hypothetical protein
VPPPRRQRKISGSSASAGRKWFPSLHALAKVDQEFVGGLEADQTRARVLYVEDDIDDDDADDRETEDMKPTPALASCHPITSQQGTNESKPEQKAIDDSRLIRRHRETIMSVLAIGLRLCQQAKPST